MLPAAARAEVSVSIDPAGTTAGAWPSGPTEPTNKSRRCHGPLDDIRGMVPRSPMNGNRQTNSLRPGGGNGPTARLFAAS